ncbi:MAG TPA: fluoride efflux transporter CrcB [Glaciibacter sp.]|nr:fluoride efflux transporter CrcB [Glaciibacter sp.]
MSVVLFLAIAAAGGVGAAARLVIDGLVHSRIRSAVPAGTAFINVSGSLLLGITTGLALAHVLPTEWQAVVGTGFLGGYTTFSTASYETVRLIQNRRPGAALASSLGMLVGCGATAAIGLLAGSSL